MGSIISLKSNVAPGAKNWLKKYFHLLENEAISLENTAFNDVIYNSTHLLSNETGLIYGIPSRLIFSEELPNEHLTKEEKLKLLLFETLLHTYKQRHTTFNEAAFIDSLSIFYNIPKEKSLVEKWIPLLGNRDDFQKIEHILTERVRVKSTIFGSNYWLNYLSNCFVFMDVILYRDFLADNEKTFFKHYNEFATFVLKFLIYAAYLDQQVEDKEEKLLWRFLASADLDKELNEKMELKVLHGITIEELKELPRNHQFLNVITFELCLFITKGTHQTTDKEEIHIRQIGELLGLTDNQMNEAALLSERFMLENSSEIFINNKTSNFNFTYKNFSERWLRILGRNKDKLVSELKESKELIALIQKSTKTELSKEEKEKVKEQFMDILKTMPSLAIFLVPGGTFLLPLILKLVPDLLPSSFKDNEIE